MTPPRNKSLIQINLHITHPGDSEEIRRKAAAEKMRYPPLFTEHFTKGGCLLCERSLKFSITIQVHKLFKPNKLHIIIEKDENHPILEMYVCKNHANVESFYKLGKSDSSDVSYLVLGIRPLPKEKPYSETVVMTLAAPHSDKLAQCSNGNIGPNRTECNCGCFVGLYAFKEKEVMTMTSEKEMIHQSLNGACHKGTITSKGKLTPLSVQT